MSHGTRYTIHTVPPGQWPWNISTSRSGTGGSNLNASSSVNSHRPTLLAMMEKTKDTKEICEVRPRKGSNASVTPNHK